MSLLFYIDPDVHIQIQHNSTVADDGSVVLDENKGVALKCVVIKYNNATVQWTSSTNEGFIVTGTSITVYAEATYTCTVLSDYGSSSASTVIKGILQFQISCHPQ